MNQLGGFPLLTDEKKRPKVLACGGVRVAGIGHAWAAFDQEALKDFPVMMARKAKTILEACIEEEKLYRTYAEASEGVSARWFEHLGFVPAKDTFVR